MVEDLGPVLGWVLLALVDGKITFWAPFPLGTRTHHQKAGEVLPGPSRRLWLLCVSH